MPWWQALIDDDPVGTTKARMTVDMKDRLNTVFRQVDQRRRDEIQRLLADYGALSAQGAGGAAVRKGERAVARKLGEVVGMLVQDPVLASDELAVHWMLVLVCPLVPEQAREYLRILAWWGWEGMPAVRVSGKQAAALMLSDIADEIIATMVPRWRAFEILFDQPLPIGNDEIVRLRVHMGRKSSGRDGELGEPTWTVRCETRGGFLFIERGTARHLHDVATLPHSQAAHDADVELGEDTRRSLIEAEHRALGLCSRLALNVILALERQGSAGVSKPSKGSRRRRARERERLPVLQLAFVVDVDVRDHVVAYLRGEVQRTYKTRWVVRGHWRNQPFGPNQSQRKRMWIAPYWKGPTARVAGTSAR